MGLTFQQFHTTVIHFKHQKRTAPSTHTMNAWKFFQISLERFVRTNNQRGWWSRTCNCPTSQTFIFAISSVHTFRQTCWNPTSVVATRDVKGSTVHRMAYLTDVDRDTSHNSGEILFPMEVHHASLLMGTHSFQQKPTRASESGYIDHKHDLYFAATPLHWVAISKRSFYASPGTAMWSFQPSTRAHFHSAWSVSSFFPVEMAPALKCEVPEGLRKRRVDSFGKHPFTVVLEHTLPTKEY